MIGFYSRLYDYSRYDQYIYCSLDNYSVDSWRPLAPEWRNGRFLDWMGYPADPAFESALKRTVARETAAWRPIPVWRWTAQRHCPRWKAGRWKAKT